MTQMTDEQKQDLFDQLMETNQWTAAEAIAAIDRKDATFERIEKLKSLIKIKIQLPVSEIDGWDEMSFATRNEVLWELGFNTRDCGYGVDLICHTWFGPVRCGEVVFSEERLDKPYLTKVVNGCNVASVDARYFYEQETLRAMKGNKK